MLRITRRVFTFAVRRGRVSFNPTFDLTHRQDAGGTDRERTRALTVEELAKLFAALRDTPRLATENALALQLLVALGVRKGELVAARWEEFDLKGKTARGPVWHLPADRSLNGEPLEIPLAPPVIQWLQMLRGLAGNSEWVFPGRRAGGKSLTGHVAGQTLNAALSGVEHGLEHFTVDDLRRTTRKQLTALGVRREVVEKCLGHRYRDRGGTYDETDYFEERRAALEKWAEVLQRAEEEKGARQRKV
jgi:integrase